VFGNPGATLRVPVSEQERSFQGDMLFLGENPAMAATIAYYAKVKPDSVRIEIADASGAVIRQVKGDTAKTKRPMPGLNLTRWDLRIEPLPEPKAGGAGGDSNNPFGGGSGREGPYVLPGSYVASVIVNGKKIGSTDVAVRSDPESQITAADRKANFELLKELQQLNGRLSDAVASARQMQTQLGAIRKELADSVKTPATFRATLDSVTKDLAPLKKKFLITDEGEEIDFTAELFRSVLPFKVGGLAGDLSGFLAGASAQNLKSMDEVRREVPAAVAETNALVTRFIAFVKQLGDAGVYPVMPKVVK